jgi:hypothetical protein
MEYLQRTENLKDTNQNGVQELGREHSNNTKEIFKEMSSTSGSGNTNTLKTAQLSENKSVSITANSG